MGAVAVGADRVAAVIAAEAARLGREIEIVRTGSRGLYWLEPLVEVEVSGKRIAYGPIAVDDVAGLFAAGFFDGSAHVRRIGPTEDIPYLKRQTRLTFARCGVTDPL